MYRKKILFHVEEKTSFQASSIMIGHESAISPHFCSNMNGFLEMVQTANSVHALRKISPKDKKNLTFA